MLSKSVAVVLLGIACVIAAAGGAYVALRQSQGNAAAEATASNIGPGSTAVDETEAVVNPPLEAAQPLPQSGPASVPQPPVVAEQPARPRSEVGRNVPRPLATAPPRTPPAATPDPVAPPTRAASPTDAPSPGRTDTASPPQPSGHENARPDPLAAVPTFDELVVPASSVIGLQIETAVSSERARLEDRVEARVARDVSIDGRTAIPAGARAIGSVTLVERGGKVSERARLGVRFHTLVLADGMELPMRTDAIFREGDSPTGESARKIGGAAVGGAILGAIIGGKKGAVVGGATGAAGGTAVVMAGDRNPATLPVGAVVTVRLSSPVTVTVERE